MTLPGLVLGFLIATGCGALFHLLRGGSLSRLGMDVFAAWIGFFVGHFVGEWLDWHAVRVGPLNLFPAILATLVALVVGSILAGPEARLSASTGHDDRRDLSD